jgi:hypothetical protein
VDGRDGGGCSTDRIHHLTIANPHNPQSRLCPTSEQSENDRVHDLEDAMRQVDHDELTYTIYTGMRPWSVTRARQIFGGYRERMEIDRQIACGVIVARLHQHMSVWDLTARFEHVGKDRITDILGQAMSAFPGAIGKLWLSGVVARKDDAQRTAANLFADALAPFEILSETSIDELLRVKFPPILPAAHALRASWP